jgi:hypothetical protein
MKWKIALCLAFLFAGCSAATAQWTPPIANVPISGITGLGTGVATALGNATNGSGGLVTYGNGLTLIGSVTTSGAQTSVTFSSIPGTYTNLLLVITARSSDAVNQEIIALQYNGDTGNNYDYQAIYGNGSSAPGGAVETGVANYSPASIAGASSSANYPSTVHVLIGAYAGTTFYKTANSIAFGADGSPAPQSIASGGGWRSTSAITSIKIFLGSGDAFVNGSQFNLYGLP